ncbi:purine-cytosine permease family protein [Amnibacterium kyonggiense]|uniref:NCS1 family nucleobase:cation symporter-1 n=1 Tax=Amnibacterium kyonggiense TaxID=595671 RepID=A0A4R7FT07_9MICO|nr:cytosine permease [Amnibacterium kyonggiense]TDS81007.1 NCS1 family nucleobase:cation symporter-1 [Amnibacterium kyonggiense]
MTTVETPVKQSFVEPGGIEAIPVARRHGSPWQLLATWSAPNLEFATVYVGVIAVAFFGLGFPQAMVALVLGNALGAITQGILSAWGPRDGVAQMVLGRVAFGTRGNILPAGLNTVMAGLGWFATNSVSGAFALATLTTMPVWLALLIIVVVQVGVAIVGHNFVQLFERYATVVLGVIFLLAAVFALLAGHLGGGAGGGPAGFNAGFGGFTVAMAAAFGYAAGWNPYAADYTRYLAPTTSKVKIGLAAGIGNFVSCTVLMAAGAAAATAVSFGKANPTDLFTSADVMPVVIGKLTLLAIFFGAISANALNIYSGAMSFLAVGIRIPLTLRRALVAGAFGVIGFFIALAASGDPSGSYENFLLVIAYWIAPWLGVVLADRWYRRGTGIARFLADDARYVNWPGFIALAVGIVVPIWLFANQTLYTGVLVAPTERFSGGFVADYGIGDLTPLVGFVLAVVVYFVLVPVFRPARGAALPASGYEEPVHVDAASER